MARRFSEHFLRRVHVLDGVWDFAFLGDVDAEGVDPALITFDDAMAVPGCFDATPKYAGRRGLAAYRRRVPVTRRGALRWVLGAAHHRAKLFAQGGVLAGHGGGFTRFSTDFFLDQPGEVELVVLLDNRFGERSPLHREKFDWYQFGGLTRGSELHELPALHIDTVTTRTLDLAGPKLEVEVHYRAFEPHGNSVPFCLTFDGESMVETRVVPEPGGGVLRHTLELPGRATWSPEHPALHLLGVQLGGDDQFERVGLRTVEVDGQKLLLNGKPLELLGVNRHEAHPAFGHAVPPQLQLSDLQLVQRLGLNFIRGSHYPQDPMFLDLCDELGLVVWNEGIAWQHGMEDLRHAQFMDAQLQHIDEMVSMSINHPSVILWGVLNESASSEPDARASYARLLNHLRSRDPSRPVTFASNRHGSDRCLDLADIVSVNAYPGWYFGTLDSMTAELDRILSWYRAAAPDKPILLAEIGAGALYGLHDYNEQRWSEEYQAELVRRVLDHFGSGKLDAIGVCLWQFCDCRTTERVETALGRPRGFNNKGLFDEYRRPKLAALVVERHGQERSKRRTPEPR